MRSTVQRQRLTPRERAIALLLAEGFKYGAIARRLSISTSTVATHVRHIKSRLGVSTRSEIVAWVAAQGTAAHTAIVPDARSGPLGEPEVSHDPDVARWTMARSRRWERR
jgi:DNA-binding CsgD family transcriptional regulator